MPVLADKVAVKNYVAARLDDSWITPSLWQGTHLPDEMPCAPPFILKSRHGCNQSIVIHDADADWQAIRRTAHGWLKKRYGYWLDETAYRDIPRGLLIEPFIGHGKTLPLDYKFYVFGGQVKFVQVHMNRAHGHHWKLFDPSWKRVSSATIFPDPAPPSALPEMITAAERLGAPFDFLRIDFYQPRKTPLFGEITFYPGSGLDPFDPPALDAIIGAQWAKVAGWTAPAQPQPLGGYAPAEVLS